MPAKTVPRISARARPGCLAIGAVELFVADGMAAVIVAVVAMVGAELQMDLVIAGVVSWGLEVDLLDQICCDAGQRRCGQIVGGWIVLNIARSPLKWHMNYITLHSGQCFLAFDKKIYIGSTSTM